MPRKLFDQYATLFVLKFVDISYGFRFRYASSNLTMIVASIVRVPTHYGRELLSKSGPKRPRKMERTPITSNIGSQKVLEVQASIMG